jgi:hypothetical protein
VLPAYETRRVWQDPALLMQEDQMIFRPQDGLGMNPVQGPRWGSEVDKIESKYYADGEDTYAMKLDRGNLQTKDVREEEDKDKGGAVGSLCKDGEEDPVNGENGKKEKMVKVKVGRGLGVGDLGERNVA